jgi:hypothetical protein
MTEIQHMRFGPDVKTEEDRRLAYWTARLSRMILQKVAHQPLSAQLHHDVQGMVEAFRVKFNQSTGYVYPRMVVCFIPEVGAIEIVREDLTEQDFQTFIVNLTVKYPRVEARQIARALARHFPQYRPDRLEFVTRAAAPPGGGIAPRVHTGVGV